MKVKKICALQNGSKSILSGMNNVLNKPIAGALYFVGQHRFTEKSNNLKIEWKLWYHSILTFLENTILDASKSLLYFKTGANQLVVAWTMC